MKKCVAVIMLFALIFCVCGCSDSADNKEATADSVEATAFDDTKGAANDDTEAQGSKPIIVGTYICKEISKDCYFIFEENGDAFAKWGTCTVYGTFSKVDDKVDCYDIDLGEFFYNEYYATINADTLTLKSDAAEYTLTKTTPPKISLDTPDITKIDKSLFGDWQSKDSYECYRFNEDGTATVTDMYNMATIDCTYSCENNTVTLSYKVSATKDGTKKVNYSIKGKDKAVIGKIEYEKVSAE